MMNTFTCIVCKKQFYAKYINSKAIYCSKKCNLINYRNINKDKINRKAATKYKIKVQENLLKPKTCTICKNIYYKSHSKDTRTYCSKKCRLERNRTAMALYRMNNRERILEAGRKNDKKRAGTEKRKLSSRNSYYRNHEKNLTYRRNLYIYHCEKMKEQERKKRQKIKEDLKRYKIYMERRNNYTKQRYHTDEAYNTKERLTSLVKHAFNKYSITGKVQSSKKYGIDYKKICEHLGPKPGEDYEIDHIIPLSSFNLNKKEEIKQSFSPSNHQWLHKHINRIKSNKILLAVLELP